MELIARKLVDAKGLITHRFKLDDFEKALETIDNPAEKPMKVIVTERIPQKLWNRKVYF